MTSFSFGGYINIIQSKHINIQYNLYKTYINLSLRDYTESIKQELNITDKSNDYLNPYDYIHIQFDYNTKPVCKIINQYPSFFILIELLHHYEFNFSNKIRSLHIADKGFCNAFKYYRNRTDDILYYLSGLKINTKRINNIYHKYAHSIDFMTGNLEYNEEDTINSLYYQIVLAMCLQKQGGSFILKIMDMCTGLSIELLYLLNYLYSDMYLIKPLSCDPNNNTKYLVCINFKMVSNIKELIHRCLFSLDMNKQIGSIFDGIIPVIFIDKIIELNLIFGQKYIEHMKHIINNKNKPSELQLDIIKKNYLSKCMKWCKKNNMPIN
jgi:hypothetical protein